MTYQFQDDAFINKFHQFPIPQTPAPMTACDADFYICLSV